MMVSTLLFSSHQRTSLLTYSDAADSGVTIKMKYRAELSADSMVDHKPAFADIDESSRNTRTARTWFHFLANRSSSRCRSMANGVDTDRA